MVNLLSGRYVLYHFRLPSSILCREEQTNALSDKTHLLTMVDPDVYLSNP